MVATDTEVMGWVEKQLQDNPEVTVDELFEGAKILQPDVAELNKRQFHARYPLQVKRRAKRAEAAAAAAEAASEAAAEAAPAPAEAPAPAPAPAKGRTTTDAEVMSWVEGQLNDNPDVSVDELLAGAVKLNAGIAELTKRQFHARYPLQVKRAARRAADAAAGIKPRRRRRKPAAPAPAPEPAAEAPAPAPEPEPAPQPEPAPAPAAEPAPEPAPAGIDREAVRKMMFGFAADITAAEDTSGVVRVLAAMDDYIDRIG
jgi:2-oxoglutarate dehydrogenase E2 component (dihydrolipoamide succinyltransferase)